MIDTSLLVKEVLVKREYETDDEPESTFYVERSSRFIYEVRFFSDYALVRPAHPDFTTTVQRMNLIEFSEAFEEYFGDPQDIRDYLWGSEVEGVAITKR